MLKKSLEHLYQPSLTERKSLVLKTFHPDNALPVIGFDGLNRPIFNPNNIDSAFDDRMEIQEAMYYHKISGDLRHGRSHLMIDFERKSTDSRIIKHIIEALISDQADIKIMPRSCDIKEVEYDPYRFREILTGIGSANNLFRRHASQNRIRDLIIPQVDNDRVLRAARLTLEAYRKSFADSRSDLSAIKLVPLIENTHAMLNLRNNVLANLTAIRGDSDKQYTRIMLAISDTTMGSGSIASLLSLRFALAEVYRIALQENHTLLPILGGGTLPFRGLQEPKHIEQILTLLPAYQITVQSAMTFDYGEQGICDLSAGIKASHKKLIANIVSLLDQVRQEQKELYQHLITQAEEFYWQDLIKLSRQGLSMPIILEQYGIRAPSRRNRIGTPNGGAGRDTKIMNQTISLNRAIGHVFGTLTTGCGSGCLLGSLFLVQLHQQNPEILHQLKPFLQVLYSKDISLASIKVVERTEQIIGLPNLSAMIDERIQSVAKLLDIKITHDEEHEQHLLNGMDYWQNGNIEEARKHFQYAAIQRKAIG